MVFPNVNNTLVSIDPNQTCIHLIFASGKILNMSANKTEIIERDKTKLIILNTMTIKLDASK